jgi:primosomal protein N' (replication factor Y)
MLSVLASGEDEKLLEQGMDYLAKFVERISGKYRVHVIGPAYASVGKVNDIYRKVLYLKHKDEIEKEMERHDHQSNTETGTRKRSSTDH